MWKISGDFRLDIAREFLLRDFIKSVKRTRILYLQTKLPSDIGSGFFEPVTLILCWCDFLGALYSGKGDWKDSTERAEIFIKEVMDRFNPKYAQSSKALVRNYRHGIVHGYTPGGNFNILVNKPEEHLQQLHRPHVLKVDINSLVDDLEKSVEWFANTLLETNDPNVHGGLAALNKARQIMLKYENEET